MLPPSRAPAEAPEEELVASPRRTGLARLLMTVSLTLMALAFVAIPSFQSPSTPEAEMQLAVAALRHLHEQQLRFADAALADVDGDGRGEFGSLSELSGAVPVRGGEQWLDPPWISTRFAAEREQGALRRGNYHYEVWLPAVGGAWIPGREATHAPARIDTDRAERYFLIYAWPAARFARDELVRAFLIDAAGEVYGCTYANEAWLGRRRVPHPLLVPGTGIARDEGERLRPRRWQSTEGAVWEWMP